VRAEDKMTGCGEGVGLISQGGGNVGVVILAGLLLLQLMRSNRADDGAIRCRDG